MNTSSEPYDFESDSAVSGVLPQDAGSGNRIFATLSARRSASSDPVVRLLDASCSVLLAPWLLWLASERLGQGALLPAFWRWRVRVCGDVHRSPTSLEILVRDPDVVHVQNPDLVASRWRTRLTVASRSAHRGRSRRLPLGAAGNPGSQTIESREVCRAARRVAGPCIARTRIGQFRHGGAHRRERVRRGWVSTRSGRPRLAEIRAAAGCWAAYPPAAVNSASRRE